MAMTLKAENLNDDFFLLHGKGANVYNSRMTLKINLGSVFLPGIVSTLVL